MINTDCIENVIAQDETILWQGRPQMRSYLLKNILQPLLLFSVAWAVTTTVLITPEIRRLGTAWDVLILCAILPMMPVWIYLGNVIHSFFGYQGIAYLITDKAVYLADAHACRRVSFAELSDIRWNIGFVEQGCGTGEVILSANGIGEVVGHEYGKGPRQGFRRSLKEFTLGNIEDYRKVFVMLRDRQHERNIGSVCFETLGTAGNHGLRAGYTGMHTY